MCDVLFVVVVVFVWHLQFPEATLKWRVEWCLTIPLGYPSVVAPAGQPSVVLKNKMLFFVSGTLSRRPRKSEQFTDFHINEGR